MTNYESESLLNLYRDELVRINDKCEDIIINNFNIRQIRDDWPSNEKNILCNLFDTNRCCSNMIITIRNVINQLHVDKITQRKYSDRNITPRRWILRSNNERVGMIIRLLTYNVKTIARILKTNTIMLYYNPGTNALIKPFEVVQSQTEETIRQLLKYSQPNASARFLSGSDTDCCHSSDDEPDEHPDEHAAEMLLSLGKRRRLT